ncbi:hypothetical protein JL722_1996 [Aureococcus anophagefferens]|nr:hypothetical protein JL722_1996 [Aureococcus anophagefferens]
MKSLANPGSPTRVPVPAPTVIPTTASPSSTPTVTPCAVLRARGEVPASRAARGLFDDGRELVAAFDGPTDKASATTGARFPCAEVLDFDGADRATCYWIDARSVNADVASAAVVPGGNVTLAAGAVRRACDAGAERCDCDRPANASSAPAAPPDPPLVPVALLDGPTTAAVCEGVVVGSSQSTGSGGRPFAYAWNATLVLRDDWVPSANTTNATLAARAAVAAVLAAANAGAGSPTLAASSDDLIAMAAGGAAGLESTTRPKALSVRANALATSCDGRPMADRAVTIAWALSRVAADGRLEATGLASTSRDPRYFKLPPYSLDAASAYALAVTAEDAAAGTNVTSTVDLAVGRAAVVAIVLGGDRVLPLAGAVELDASESYDEDGTWVFAVNVTSPDGRSAAAAVVYELVDDDPPAVEVDAWTSSVGTRVAASKKIVLYGDAQPSSLGRAVSTSRTFNTTWVLERGTLADEAPLAVWARTAPALSGYARDREHDLVLAVGAIVAGAHYSLRLDATLEGIDTAGSASVTFYVARPPSSGRLLASPAAGFALETTFELSTRSWTSSALLSVASNGSGLAAAAASSALDSCEGLAAASGGDTGITAVAAAGLGDTLSSLLDSPLFAAGNGSSNASAGASLGSSVDGILAAQLAGAVAGEYAMTLSSPNLKSSAQRLSPNATTPGEVRALSLDGAASAAELRRASRAATPTTRSPPRGHVFGVVAARPSARARGPRTAGRRPRRSFAEYATDPYAGEDGGGGAALTARVARFGLAPSSAEPASRRARARRLEDAGGAGGGGAGLASVALTIGGGVARNASRPPGANLTCACGYEGNVSFACPDNATVVEAACDGLPNVIEVVCPGVETACAAWNATAAAWRSSCEAVGGADGATTCACDVDASGAAAPTDFSTEDEATDAGSVYFKNLTEPPDLSRALIMIYALLALLGACVAAHAYGRRLDARDAAAARAASAVAAASDADDDPYEVNDDHDVLTAGWKQNFLTGMDLGHPFYGWYTLYSASVPRPFRAWCCGFEILVFMYALAFETNLLFPDVEEECAGKLNPETCASLKTVLRGKFKGTHVESAPLCQWMPCAEACVMEEPGEDEMSPMSAARRPERGPTRRDNGRARRPVCKIFAYLAENYLVAPVPLALRWRRGSASPAGAPAARAASSPEDEPPIPTLKIDWDETGAPEASPGTLASSAGPESAVADDELLRKLRAAVEEPGGAAPAAAGDPDKEPLEILEIKERPDGGEARARAHELLEGGPPDAWESQAPIPEGGAADGDATGFTVSCSVQCDGAACVAPVDAGAACLSSTLDDAFAVPSRTAACLFGLDRLEDEVPRARVAEARPAAADEAAPVDDGDLVVPEMGEWVESLVGDLDARLEPDDVEPLARGPGEARGAPELGVARDARHLEGEIRRAAGHEPPHALQRQLQDDGARLRGDARAHARARSSRGAASCGAAAAATSRTTARRLGELDAHLLERWGFNGSRQVFIANVERVVVKRLGRAARWHAELEAADDARAKERAAVAYLRAEMLSKKERTVMTTIAERLQGELEAPEEPPGAAPYIAAWAGVLCVVLYCFYYLLTTGSQFGRKKTRLWLEAVTFSLVLYFVFIKPIVVLLISVIMPSFVASSVDKTRSPLDHPRYPFETPLPESSVFYLLRWHPELNGTRLADHVAAEATGAPRSARECLTDVRVAEIHGAAIPRTSGTAVVLALIALLFGLHEDIQDTLIEEVFTFLPLASGFVAERTPGLESAGEDVGAAFGMVVVGALVYVAWKAYHACGKATARAAVALPRRKSDAGGPAFRWPEDEAPETPRPDVAGEDEKSPEDAVALVLFDGGGDGDRVEAARPDDDEAAAERPGDAASDGEFLDDEEILLDVDVRRADADARGAEEARGAEAAAQDDHEAGTRRRATGGRGLRPRPETLSDYVFSVQAKPEDAPAPSYSDAAYAAVFGAAAAARDDHDAGDAVAARPGEARSARAAGARPRARAGAGSDDVGPGPAPPHNDEPAPEPRRSSFR